VREGAAPWLKNAWFAGPILQHDDVVLREMPRRTRTEAEEARDRRGVPQLHLLFLPGGAAGTASRTGAASLSSSVLAAGI